MVERRDSRRIVLGITGSIAAYKAAELARLLVTDGYEVRVVMTESAAEFITPLTLQSITSHPVTTDFWSESDAGIGHIQLADWADAVVIAPATADVLAKMAYGFSETPLLAIALATRSPILVAPAMNVNMLEHAATQANIASLKTRGVSFVEPEVGALACGWNGAGRLADPREIVAHVRRILTPQELKGKRVVISTGPTREPIDPVRFLSNRSSGKMGVALAIEAFHRGADVTLVHGPVRVSCPDVIHTVPVVTAVEMRDAVIQYSFPDPSREFAGADIVIMAAAVSDYRAKEQATKKMKRTGKAPIFELVENPDILKEVSTRRGAAQVPTLVGFAVETGEVDDLLAEVRKKMQSKAVDLMVGNRASDSFDLDTNHVWILDRNGRQEEVATMTKSRVAMRILDAVLKL